MGEHAQSLSFSTMIARVMYDRGRYGEAEQWVETAVAGPKENLPFGARPLLSRTVYAKVLARGGEFERAEALARRTLHEHKGSDEIEERAVMLMDLAEILVLAERREDAVPVVEEATGLYDRKGHLLGARKTRRFMNQLLSPQSAAGTR